ncbi:MAG: shikimate dehydrogenase [Pseudomonadota bacterium]
MTEPRPPLAGVVGWPISHSRSPRLHGHWLARHGLDGHYIPLGLPAQDFEAGVRHLPRLGFRGINVTIPYKETVLAIATRVSDRAALIGSANMVTFREDGGILADNTDGVGFIASLASAASDWRASQGPALVIGAGGAARAVVSALLAERVPEVRVANRTRQRAEMLQEQFGARIVVVDWNRASDAMDGAKTIVNATSLGMMNQGELNVTFAAAPYDALATDLVYTPINTPFLQKARAQGLRTVDGLGMLLHQAVPCFESWFGTRPKVDDAARAAISG